MILEPMQAAMLGGWEIILVLGFFFLVVVIPVCGIVAIVYLIVNRSKTKPQPSPLKPVPEKPVSPLQPKPVTPSPMAAQGPTVPTKTEVMPRKCPQCGATLQPDAPEGLCPACLLQRGFATEGGAPPGQSSFVPPPIDELAKLFPQLEILECLGRGGMGAVYKARQPRLDRFVALKILAPEKQGDPQFAERFEREARVLARLSHPNIVSVFDFGEVQGRFYLLMEFVDGLTLRQVMQGGKISPEQALELVPKICEALQYAHGQGIVHRDIKPENILLDKQGHLKIADFGIAKIAGVEGKELSLTGARDVMGTPVYMAPEQVEKPQSVDHRADIYSLGVVFYEMLTGELPLGKFAPPSKKVQVDVRLDEVVLHALEKEPARRYQQAEQVKTAVEGIAGSPPPIGAVSGTATAGSASAGTSNITAPAVALIIAGLWKVFSGVLGMLAVSGMSGWLGNFSGLGNMNLFGGWSSVAVSSVALFKVIPGLLIMFGGYQMLQRRSYAWAVAAGILAIVACSLVGLPVGIWALVILARDNVKAAFGVGGAAAATPGSSAKQGRFWPIFAVVIACVLLIPIVAAIIGVAIAGFAIPGYLRQLQVPAYKELTAQELQKAGIWEENGQFWKTSNQTFPLDAKGRFNIDNVKGKIEIEGWSSNLVALDATIHGKTGGSVDTVKINIDSEPGNTTVHTDQPRETGFWAWLKSGRWNDATVDYVVHVPEHAQLSDVSTVNGTIEIGGVAGDINASTINGDMDIKDAAHNLKLSTVNGTATANMGKLEAGQSVSFSAVNGEFDLTVPEDANAEFSVTTINGNITSDFPSLQAKRELVGNNLKGTLGNGGARVKVDAVNGTVKFLKGPPAASICMAAAEKWLGMIDEGNYGGSWKEASPLFQSGVTSEDWEKSMNTFRKPLGSVLSRQRLSARPATEMPGAPDGHYVVMQFKTSFANKESAIETVTFDLEKDGLWKSCGYFIK